ncbi:hypothetical protein NPIL_703701 [Nephila pilipes]|uniref:Uncharacterized protein n=1 Tax=Nephila pilipes TaxID=299642 RepID=A0A8X6MV89_NEPPI|nr:hypothetical protein NPIL_703701 [Nephila pilipes]
MALLMLERRLKSVPVRGDGSKTLAQPSVVKWWKVSQVEEKKRHNVCIDDNDNNDKRTDVHCLITWACSTISLTFLSLYILAFQNVHFANAFFLATIVAKIFAQLCP